MARARLSMAFQDLRGTMGNQVLVLTDAGLAVRRKARYKYPVHQAMQDQMNRMSQANEAYNTLTATKIDAWRKYGLTQKRTDDVTLKQYALKARTAFIGLSTKFLQADPTGAIPVTPPASDFDGDSVLLDVEPLAGVGVRFTSSSANESGVVTELMMQQLANIRRSPTKYYKSAAFHAFPATGSHYDLPLEPGLYAFAYRFVKSATGQSTGVVTLEGIIEVE